MSRSSADKHGGVRVQSHDCWRVHRWTHRRKRRAPAERDWPDGYRSGDHGQSIGHVLPKYEEVWGAYYGVSARVRETGLIGSFRQGFIPPSRARVRIRGSSGAMRGDDEHLHTFERSLRPFSLPSMQASSRFGATPDSRRGRRAGGVTAGSPCRMQRNPRAHDSHNGRYREPPRGRQSSAWMRNPTLRSSSG